MASWVGIVVDEFEEGAAALGVVEGVAAVDPLAVRDGDVGGVGQHAWRGLADDLNRAGRRRRERGVSSRWTRGGCDDRGWL